MTTDTTSLHPDVIGELRRRVSGRIAFPADPAYPELVTGHDVAADHRPAVVVEPVDAADVQEAVAVAAAHGLKVAVQATGHGTGHPVRGGVLLVTQLLDSITVDAQERTVTVGAGVTWGPLAAAVAPHGLTPVTTNGPGVGVVGSTLGGGVGPLARSHGFVAEHVAGMDVVTADGLTRRVVPGTDLHWALCGGRDGIGVVTAITLDLHEPSDLWGGELVWVGPELDEALGWWHGFAAQAPATVTTSAMAGIAPDVEEVPQPLRGRPMLRVTLCAAASEESRIEELLATAPTPAIRALAPLTIADFLARHGDVAPPMPTWQRGFALVDLSSEALDLVRGLAGPSSGAPLIGVEIRRLGGALRRPVEDSISGRDAEWLVSIIGVPEPALFAEVLPDLARRLGSALEPWSTGGSLLNFHGRPVEGHELDRSWPTDVNARLRQIRSRVDPEGAFTRGPTDLAS